MHTMERDVAENALRLIEKARGMSMETAAVYLTPLTFLPSGSPASTLAVKRIDKLVDQLQASSADIDVAWREAISACKAWRDAATASSL